MIYRNPKLLKLCRDLPCQQCGIEDGTVVAAHRNQTKGMGLKANDYWVAALCHKCHHDLDNGNRYSLADRRNIWNEAFVNTMGALFAAGKVVVK